MQATAAVWWRERDLGYNRGNLPILKMGSVLGEKGGLSKTVGTALLCGTAGTVASDLRRPDSDAICDSEGRRAAGLAGPASGATATRAPDRVALAGTRPCGGSQQPEYGPDDIAPPVGASGSAPWKRAGRHARRCRVNSGGARNRCS